MKTAIELRNVSKKYSLPVPPSLGDGRNKTGASLLWRWMRGRGKVDFWALKDLDLDVPKGQMLGVLGPNGSGKSTLLKLIARIASPTRGSVHVSGRVSALLELGTGFHPDLSGYENIFLYGSLLGLTREDLRRKIPEIADFSGLTAFLDTPVKHFSSGMFSRLGFSVAVHIDPDVLLLDEILAVGDAEFQSRSFGKIRELRAAGKTLLLVTHDLEKAAELCDSLLWLENGERRACGQCSDVILAYRQHENRKRVLDRSCFQDFTDEALFENLTMRKESVRFHAVRFLDSHDSEREVHETLAPLTIEVAYETLHPVSSASFLLILAREDGLLVGVESSIPLEGSAAPRGGVDLKPGPGRLRVRLEPNLLMDGRYHVSLGVFQPPDVEAFHGLAFRQSSFRVATPDYHARGVVAWLPCQWTHQPYENQPKVSSPRT
ncbi:MAG: ABC transporter ATP-binding protein [bacterium]